MKRKVAIVIPVCNEQDNIPVILPALRQVMDQTGYPYSVTFIDDGSSDNTLEVLKTEAAKYNNVFYIGLSRNFGHQNALKAGIDLAEGDCTIMMDGDMQHPPDLLPELLKRWEEGYDIVYTIRRDHEELPLMKRKTSNMFYDLINNLSDIELEQGTADFRLMDGRVIEVFRAFKETDLFLRGLVKWMGFRQIGIEYDPAMRTQGKSKYTMKKMIRFALQGITSFSTRPLYIAAYLGFVFSLLSLLYIPYIIYSYYFGHTISGWASIVATIVFFGGLQLMILGIIGMYLGKLFIQGKQRPHYIIRETNMS
ncbi:glycosyltransferase family 2 protein [Sediminibacterium ginsengisoli]|uniref:Dolichol-phosphate mannosyltransferase n=1 Tax=Sediminibacterium ginsengisoli TaxID=413434 RepID=A0A1T4JR18_9BACT|nr:glycosyltransferase family 2 protein [Sediminibacterium ginsengisoli]SJZ32598.1 dolichol-phosphate mannosyltransferase [Sediminibacterium ginsengisoli]